MKSILKAKSNGYTLMEAVIGIGVLGIMATVAVPLVADQIVKGKSTSAENTCQTIATAVSAFYSHTNEWPNASQWPRPKLVSFTTDKVDDSNAFLVLRSGTTEFDAKLDPDFDSSPGVELWKVAPDKIGYINDHLLSDKIGYGGGGLHWKGPYINPSKQDPFGRNFLVYIRATYKKSDNGKPLYGWVVSAGPNEKIETAPTDTELKGDDVGALIIAHPTTQIASLNNAGSNRG